MTKVTCMILQCPTQGRLSQTTLDIVLEPLIDAFNDKVAKIRKLAVVGLSKVGPPTHQLCSASLSYLSKPISFARRNCQYSSRAQPIIG